MDTFMCMYLLLFVSKNLMISDKLKNLWSNLQMTRKAYMK